MCVGVTKGPEGTSAQEREAKMLRKAFRGALLAVVLLAIPGLAVAYETGLLERLANPASSTSAGIAIKIQSVAIGADRKPVVTFKLTDAAGVPVARSSVTTLSF